MAFYQIIAHGMVFSRSYRWEGFLYEVAVRICSQGSHKVDSVWYGLKGGPAREKRTMEVYNLLAQAATDITCGFRTAVTEAVKASRRAANLTVHTLLNQIH